MRIVIGHVGSDAGWIWIDEHGHIHRVPGWQPDAIADLRHAVTVMREAAALKQPGVAEAAIGAVQELVQKELAEHLDGGGVLVLA